MSLLNYSIPSGYPINTPIPALSHHSTAFFHQPLPQVAPRPVPQPPYGYQIAPPPAYQRRENPPPPPRQPYVRVPGGDDDRTRTRVHAVIDYDEYEDDYEDDGRDRNGGKYLPPPPSGVTPIQGPIFIKNGTVPVVPLYSYPVLSNGSFVQIPILWTALSVALGLELKGELIRGVPCIKRHQQLMCPTAGNSYPLDRIELFIDENKALMKRMYGEFAMTLPPQGAGPERARRHPATGDPDLHFDPGPGFAKTRRPRQAFRANRTQGGETGRVDACESKVEIVTPYWASNSAGKVRAIVNTQHFEQAIHQEVCSRAATGRCNSDCGCEQKYKWHRLLAYDPDNDCKGIFMDWFLFPSCCVCRCNP